MGGCHTPTSPLSGRPCVNIIHWVLYVIHIGEWSILCYGLDRGAIADRDAHRMTLSTRVRSTG